MNLAVRGTLKTTPEDFLVSESLLLRAREGGRFTYVRLRKRGFTTFEAVERLADHFRVERRSVAFAGLKDEDGVTEQTLGLDFRPDDAAIARFNETFGSGNASMAIFRIGTGDDPVVTGELEGNAFRVVVRGLDDAGAAGFAVGRAREVAFLNYYDTQRFGVPGGPKLTHGVGRALARQDHATALALVRRLESPESPRARAFEGEPRRFFEDTDPRILSFYFSAAESADWNARLADALRVVAQGAVIDMEEHGVAFAFASRVAVLGLLASNGTLPYRRYRAAGGVVVSDLSARPTVVPTRVRCVAVGDDELSAGRKKIELAFFLPSGCYATMCLKALLLGSG